MSKKEMIGIPEFNNRINNWMYLDNPSNHEIMAICKSYGINDDKFISFLINQSYDYRTIQNTIQNNLRK